MKSLTKDFFAPAKINLRLEVLHKRHDGYHEISSIMCPVDVCDTLTLSTSPAEGVKITTTNAHLPAGMSNLAYQAASLFMSRAKISGGIAIHLEKNIPLASGLGGGSSDAAAVMKGLNELYDAQWSLSELVSLGAHIGADVPFFFLQGPAHASGIGEKLKTIRISPPFWALLITPPIPISTAWVYSQCKPNQDGISLDTTQRIDLREAGEKILRNDLEDVVLDRYPEVAEIKQVMQSLGAWGTLMSGSGPTVFGIFFNKTEVESAKAQVALDYRHRNWTVSAAKALL
jgi:4-diphosphocytidyl-2-C-methyl-D-erythritol kinase